MKRFGVGLIVLGICIGSASTAQAQKKGKRGKDNAAKYGWLSSLAAGKEQARRSGKPLMVVIRCVP